MGLRPFDKRTFGQDIEQPGEHSFDASISSMMLPAPAPNPCSPHLESNSSMMLPAPAPNPCSPHLESNSSMMLPAPAPNPCSARLELFSFEKPFIDPRLEPTPLVPSCNELEEDPCSMSSHINCAAELPVVPDDSSSSSSSSKGKVSKHERDLIPLAKRRKRDYCGNETDSRFRPHQDMLWQNQFERLLAFKDEHGHTCVPISFSEDEILARWVKRQRYQYKKYQDGKSSAINTGRITMLDSIGFVWDAHAAVWQEKWNALAEYKRKHGHCNIPSHNPNNLILPNWVKCQRRQYSLYQSGKQSNMTTNRIAALDSLGFDWTVRRSKSN